MVSSNASLTPCSCTQDQSIRAIEKQFYSEQQSLVEKTVRSLPVREENTPIFEQLLGFMGEYLNKIVSELSKEELCECKQQKISENMDLSHKVAFLREENHKFFKII